MKKTMLSGALLLGLAPFLVQCVASEQDLRGLELRSRTLDNRVSELEQLNETVRGQAAGQARLGNELENLNNRLLRHEGRMDEAEHQQSRLRQEYQDSQQAVSMRLDNIDIALQDIGHRLEETSRQMLAAFDEVNLALAELERQQEHNQQQIREIKEQRAREAAQRAEEARRAAEQARREAAERAQREAAREERERERALAATRQGPPREITPEQVKQRVGEGQISRPEAAPESPRGPEPPPEPAAPVTADAADDDFSRGVRHLEAGEYLEAYTALGLYLEENPRGEQAADARFLLGESLYGQQEYELAILEYQKVIADFSGHRRVPEALLRQGMAFEQLREPSTAVIVYERLIEEFPDRHQADEARQLLEAIN